MQQIRNQINRLNVEERKTINYAFENGQPYHYVFEDGTFVGVNLTNEPHLLIEQAHGVWSIGKRK